MICFNQLSTTVFGYFYFLPFFFFLFIAVWSVNCTVIFLLFSSDGFEFVVFLKTSLL